MLWASWAHGSSFGQTTRSTRVSPAGTSDTTPAETRWIESGNQRSIPSG